MESYNESESNGVDSAPNMFEIQTSPYASGDTQPKHAFGSNDQSNLHTLSNSDERNDKTRPDCPRDAVPDRVNSQRRDVEETLEGINALVGQLRNVDQRVDRRLVYNRPKVMPDIFDGKVAWPQYQAHFETVADLNGWNERERAQYLAVSLRGEACQIIQLLNPEIRRNYRQLVEAMNRRFHPNHSESLYRTQLRTITRGPRQSLPQLAQTIRALAAQAYPTADNRLLDSLCCDHFLEALQDGDMKMRLIGGNIDRFDDMVSQAIKFEAWGQAHGLKTSKRYVHEVSTNSPQLDKHVDMTKHCNNVEQSQRSSYHELNDIKEKLKHLQDLMQGLLKQSDGKRSIECYYCHEKGHIKPSCPKLAEERKHPFNGRKQNSN